MTVENAWIFSDQLTLKYLRKLVICSNNESFTNNNENHSVIPKHLNKNEIQTYEKTSFNLCADRRNDWRNCYRLQFI